jgi:hypothetical protein
MFAKGDRKTDERSASAMSFAHEVQNALKWTEKKSPFERQWMMNFAYLMGEQDLRWDKRTASPVRRTTPGHRSKIRPNKVLPAIEMAIAQATQRRPEWDAKPGTGSIEDRRAARLANPLLDYLWEEAEMETVVEEVVLWAASLGTGFFLNTLKRDRRTRQRIYVDPNGNTIPSAILDDGQRAMLDRQGLYVEYYAHEPTVEALSPFRVAFDPNAGSLDKARFMGRIELPTIDEVYEEFGVVVEPESLPNGLVEYEEQMRSFYGPGERGVLYGGSNYQGATSERTVLREYLRKPYYDKGEQKEYPNGRHVVVAGGKVLIDQDNPYFEAGFRNGFNVTAIQWHKIPNRIFGIGIPELMIDPQLAYTEIRRMSIDAMRVQGQPKWLSPKTARLRRKSINDMAGEVIEYDAMGGPPPQPIVQRPFDPAAIGLLTQAAMSDLADARGTHDIMDGNIPGQMRSGPAMELAMEGDLAKFSTKTRGLERALGRVGENLLAMCAEVLDEDAAYEILGDKAHLDMQGFRIAMLKGVKSVRVVPGSMKPRSKATEQQKALDMVQVGGLNPAGSSADRAILIRALNFQEHDPERNRLMKEMDRAERENDAMRGNLEDGSFSVPPIMPYDDHLIHEQVHYDLICSAPFERYPEWKREAVLSHYLQHQNAINQARQAAVQEKMMVKGAPGQKGTPSPPKQ